MRTSYQYRLKPTREQAEKIDKTLDISKIVIFYGKRI
jgi:hypothetical protein